MPFGAAVAGTTFNYGVTAQGSPTPTFSLSVAPPGMTINNRLISWTPSLTQIGIYDVTVTASNASGSVDQSFQVTVTPPSVTGLTASNITANGALLSWNQGAPEAGTVIYNLYECLRGKPQL